MLCSCLAHRPRVGSPSIALDAAKYGRKFELDVAELACNKLRPVNGGVGAGGQEGDEAVGSEDDGDPGDGGGRGSGAVCM